MGLSRTDLEFLNDDARASMLAPWRNNRAYVAVPSFTVGSNGTVYRSLRANGVDDDGNNVGPGAVDPISGGAGTTWTEAFPQVNTANFVPTSRQVATSGALSGGGSLAANRTLTVRTATTSQTGVVLLATSISSTSTSNAATSSAVNAVRLIAEGRVLPTRNINTSAPITGGGSLAADRTIGISNATTSARGAVQLSTSTTSTSTATAATSSAVRTVQNNANSRVPTSRTISVSAPITGGGDLSVNRSIGISTASTTAPGAVQLTDSTTSTSATLVPTIRSITSLRADVNGRVPAGRTISTTAPIRGGGNLSANRTISIDTATTSRRGSVQLSTSTTSTSTTTAATSSAVRTADINSRNASRLDSGTLNLARLPLRTFIFNFTSAGAVQTFTTPAGARALRFRMVSGGGGGGGGSRFANTGSTGRGGNGGSGQTTSVSNISAGRGGSRGNGGGQSFGSGGGGRSVQASLASGADVNEAFFYTERGMTADLGNFPNTGNIRNIQIGNGGGGGGTPLGRNDEIGNQEEDSPDRDGFGHGGAGGGGGEEPGIGGGGGGAGAYIEYIERTPLASYNIVVGAGGAGGTGDGSGGVNGGSGARGGNGVVIVEVY